MNFSKLNTIKNNILIVSNVSIIGIRKLLIQHFYTNVFVIFYPLPFAF